MSSERLEFSAQKLGRALDRLDEALSAPYTDLLVDATIQRFEFTFELLWKTLKRALEEKGRAVSATPADVLSAAWQADWLEDDEDTWIAMIKDRNLSSHVYDEAGAFDIYSRIPSYAPLMRKAYDALRKRFRLPPPSAPASSRPRSGPSTAGEKRVPYPRTPSPLRGRGRGACPERAERAEGRGRGRRSRASRVAPRPASAERRSRSRSRGRVRSPLT